MSNEQDQQLQENNHQDHEDNNEDVAFIDGERDDAEECARLMENRRTVKLVTSSQAKRLGAKKWEFKISVEPSAGTDFFALDVFVWFDLLIPYLNHHYLHLGKKDFIGIELQANVAESNVQLRKKSDDDGGEVFDIFLPFIQYSKFNPEQVSDAVERVSQSRRVFNLDQQFGITITTVKVNSE